MLSFGVGGGELFQTELFLSSAEDFGGVAALSLVPKRMKDKPNCLSFLNGWRHITRTQSHFSFKALLLNDSVA
jgi:hypothetical protein